MSNDTSPKRWDSKLQVSNGFVMLDIKFREEAEGKARFNMTAKYDIVGPSSEWKDEGKFVGNDIWASIIKNDTFVYLAGSVTDKKDTIRFVLQQLEPSSQTINFEDMPNKLGFQWELGYDSYKNELIFASHLAQTKKSLIYFRDGLTLKPVVEPRKRLITLNDSGPIRSVQKMNETHQLLHLYPVAEAQSEHKNELYILDTEAQNLTKVKIDDLAIGANTTFRLSSYDFNRQTYWIILPHTDADTGEQLEFPKKPVFVTKDFEKRYEFDIGVDKQTRAIFHVKNKFVVAQAKEYKQTDVWQMSDSYSYDIKKAVEKELE